MNATTKRFSLLCGLSVVLSLSAPALAAAQSDPLVVPASAKLEQSDATFLPPVKLQAAGQAIDMGKWIGYSGPTVMDHDGDGKLDLLVGSFKGKIQFFRNTGSNPAPVYAKGEFLQAEGQDIEISNW